MEKVDKGFAIVTGNSKGIGKAISTALRKKGIIVPEISRTWGYDLMTEKGLTKLFTNYPSCDILCNNVGGGGRWGENIFEFTEWDKVMYKNLGLTKTLTLYYLPKMLLKKWGRVVTISSIYAERMGAYSWFSMAKRAQVDFTRDLAYRYENSGITFNAILPSNVKVRREETYKIHTEDIANLVLFLVSDKAKFINGEAIAVGRYYEP